MQPSQELKISNEDAPDTSFERADEEGKLYDSVEAVFLLFDPRKSWTLDFVEGELERIPARVFTLVLANFRDVDPDAQSVEVFMRAKKLCDKRASILGENILLVASLCPSLSCCRDFVCQRIWQIAATHLSEHAVSSAAGKAFTTPARH